MFASTAHARTTHECTYVFVFRPFRFERRVVAHGLVLLGRQRVLSELDLMSSSYALLPIAVRARCSPSLRTFAACLLF